MSAAELPDGVVTFLMTDIRGSTRLWEEHAHVMSAVLDRHDALIGSHVDEHSGVLIRSKGEGDSTLSVFTSADDAVAAAVRVQLAIAHEPWPEGIGLQIRAALHTGETQRRGDDYSGIVLNRCARLRSVAHGGQTLCSHTTHAALTQTPPDTSLRDLGVHRLRDLARAERIYQLVHDDVPDEFPPLDTLDVRHNLPVQRTTFVGRERETASVAKLLTDERLVTLVGTGGCGKTRLAIEVAWRQLDLFPDGVFFVDLSPVADAALIPATVAGSVAFARPTIGTDLDGPMVELIDVLSTRDVLIVLDNCEHLVEACAELVDRILGTCPGVKVLATSREPLVASGEQIASVPPLTGPDADLPETADSVRLFYDRATLARRNFVPSSEHTSDVVEICERLDGIPLAIELAAAQIAYLSPRQIVEHLSDRFGLLTGGPRHTRRQETLRSTIDWSFDLLEETERAVLRRFAVFPGSFSLDAARAVCADRDVIASVRALVAKSLVGAEDVGVDVRYRLLETIRVYADDRLREAGDMDDARDRHRDHFVAWAEAIPPERTYLDPDGVLQLEQHNLRAALRWSEQQGRPDLVARLFSTMNRIWLGDVPEARRWMDVSLIAADDLDPDRRVRVLAVAAQVAVTAIEATDGALAQRAVDACDGTPGIWPSLAHGLLCLARGIATILGHGTAAEVEELGSRAIQLAPEPMSRGLAAFWLGQARTLLGDTDGAIDALEDAAVQVIPGGDVAPIAQALLAGLWHIKGDEARAWTAAERSLESTRSPEASRGLWAWVLYDSLPYALALGTSGRHDEALQFLRELLDEGGTSRGRGLRCAVVITLAGLAHHRGDLERACVLLGNAWHAIIRGERTRTPVDIALFGHFDGKVRPQLDAETARRLFAEGESMMPEEAIAFGLERIAGAEPAPW